MVKESVLKKSFFALSATILAVVTLVTISASAGASSQGKSVAAEAAKPGANSIVELVLTNDGEFDVLQAAVVKAGLVDALSGGRQYTVFAPTDAAFVSTLGVANEAAAIAAVEGLPLDTLQNILKYHVMPGRHTSTSVLARSQYRMLNGEWLSKTDLSNAGIENLDISARNGVIHIINHVLMP